MFGVKTVAGKKFCAVCEVEVDDNHNFCSNCGNPLNLDSAAKRLDEQEQHVDEFITRVVGYAKDNDASLKDAIKNIRENYFD